MKLLIAALLALALPAQALDYDLGLKYNLTFVPPHNEPIVGSLVARYRAEITPTLQLGKYVHYELDLTTWGVNKWRTSEVVGHGFPEAWEGSDWSVDEWRVSTTHRLILGAEKFHGYVEGYRPIDGQSWGGVSMRHYHLLVGFGGSF